MGRAKLSIYVLLLLSMLLSVNYAEGKNTNKTNNNSFTNVVAPPKPIVTNNATGQILLVNKKLDTKSITAKPKTENSVNNVSNTVANPSGNTYNNPSKPDTKETTTSNTSNTSNLGNAPLISNADAQLIEENTAVGTEDLRDEIVNLRNELQQLNRSIEEYRQRNVDLQQTIEDYKKQEASNGSLFKLQFLRSAVLDPIFSNPVLRDPNYSEAVLDIVYGEIEPAEQNLTTFFLSDINVEDHLKDASSISADYDVRLSALKADLQLRQDSANFLLGYTKLLLFKPQESIEYFAKSYNNTQNFNLVLLNLIALIDAFTAVGRNQEACDTVKRYYTNIAQSKGSNKPLPNYLTLEVEEKIASTKQAINCK